MPKANTLYLRLSTMGSRRNFIRAGFCGCVLILLNPAEVKAVGAAAPAITWSLRLLIASAFAGLRKYALKALNYVFRSLAFKDAVRKAIGYASKIGTFIRQIPRQSDVTNTAAYQNGTRIGERDGYILRRGGKLSVSDPSANYTGVLRTAFQLGYGVGFQRALGGF